MKNSMCLWIKNCFYGFAAITSLLIFCSGLCVASEMKPETLKFAPFGKVIIYRKTPPPSQVVLFVSGDGGWKRDVVDMANVLTEMNALVVGIDFPKYRKGLSKAKGKCLYCAADFENLSKYIQKIQGFPSYIKPTLFGFHSGATLVYALLVQAPANSYQGVVSIGFCPNLNLPKPMCRGNGLEWTGPFKGKNYTFLPSAKVEAPWIVFQQLSDQAGEPPSIDAFVRSVNAAQLIPIAKTDLTLPSIQNGMPQFKTAFKTAFTSKQPKPATVSPVSDLPLKEVIPSESKGDFLAVIVTGDGGWATIDKEIGADLAEAGIPVVGLNSLSYFWTKRNPEVSARDLERIISHYLSTWKKNKVLLIGYSFGADVLPFMVNRLSQEARSHVSVLSLIGLSPSADFEFKPSGWVGKGSTDSGYPVIPELENLKGHLPVVCIEGSEDTECACKDIHFPWIKRVTLPGGHHFGGAYERLTRVILAETKTIENR